MKQSLTCFKAYDIRGRLGDELNEDIAWRIGRAFAAFLAKERPSSAGRKGNTVVVGGDIRQTSEALKRAVANGLRDGGCDVIDIGMVGTEEIYFATQHLGLTGGIEITASHNPIDYNGMKLVREDSKPVSNDSGLLEIKRLAEANDFSAVDVVARGSFRRHSVLDAYSEHLLTYIDLKRLRPLTCVVNTGNGAAGHVIDALETQFARLNVPLSFIKLHHQPDGTFPNGIPNPLLPENRGVTAAAVRTHEADMGIAWDGDFDRCFLFDENGTFIEGYYIVGLLAEAFLHKNRGAKIIHDPRLTWNTVDIVSGNGGEAVQCKTGHAFIKERMRLEDAVYGGEMSAHHYFRDFGYCDSGMIPWLLVAELVCVKRQSLSALIAERVSAYPSPGEINVTVKDADAVIARVLAIYQPLAMAEDNTDGISLTFERWRFNLRQSNTEPLLRLNLETRGDKALMAEKTEELLAIINAKINSL